MQRRRRVLGAIALTLVAASAAAETGAPAWEVASESDGVRVLTRDVAGSEVYEVRAFTTLPVAPEVVMAVLGDVDRYPEIMPPTSAVRQLGRSGLAADYYIVIDPPVISARDGCTHIEYSRRASSFHVAWRPSTGCPKAPDGMVRMVANSGTWDVRPALGGTTHVTYSGHADPGGALPTWLINRAVVGGSVDTLGALRTAASDPRYLRCLGNLALCLPWL